MGWVLKTNREEVSSIGQLLGNLGKSEPVAVAPRGGSLLCVDGPQRGLTVVVSSLTGFGNELSGAGNEQLLGLPAQHTIKRELPLGGAAQLEQKLTAVVR